MWVSVRIERFFEEIVSRLEAIQKALNGPRDADTDQNASDGEERWSIAGVVREITYLKRAENQKADSAYDKSYGQQERLLRSQKWLVRWAGWAFAAASFYGIVAAFQYCEMQKSTKAAESAAKTAADALTISNRPWVGQFSDPIFSDKPVVGENSVESNGVRFEIKNYGVSPALHVSVNIVPDILAPPKSPETFFEQSEADIRAACNTSDSMTKDIETAAFAGSRGALIKKPAGGETIFPNGVVPILLPINLKMGQQTTERHALDLFGCISYRDQFDRVIHHTRFCYMTAGRINDTKAGDRLEPCAINQNAD